MMSYFGLREWKICNANVRHLSDGLDKMDREKLEFDLKTIDWNEYFLNYMPGIKKYFFKENYSNIERCKRHYRR